MLVEQNPKAFQPVLDFFRTEYEAINFESEAVRDICKEEFVVKKRKVTETQPENLLQNL